MTYIFHNSIYIPQGLGLVYAENSCFAQSVKQNQHVLQKLLVPGLV